MSSYKQWWVLALTLLLAGGAEAGEEMMSIQVKTGQLRNKPSFLGTITTTVSYGDRVAVVSEQGEWREVRKPTGQSGWIHLSALTEKEIVLRAGAEDVQAAASSDELALAGKGFNAQVEAEFKAQNKEIDFTWVDRMEKFQVTPEEMVVFLKEGEVEPREGGGK